MPRRTPRFRFLAMSWSLLLAFASSARLAAEVPADPHRWALLIGINAYTELQGLNCAAADMRTLRDHLLRGGFPTDQVILMEDQTSDTRCFPSKFNIEKQLELITGLAEPGDIVVIGFSGHGLQVNGQSYLCPIDAQSVNIETMVAVDEIYSRLNASRATFKLCIIDACRSNPFKGGAKATDRDPQLAAFSKSLYQVPQGVVVLSSCDAGQFSFEDHAIGHGLFIYYLTEGLSGAADTNRDLTVSLHETFQHAAMQTKRHAQKSYNQLQVPKLRGDVTAEAFDFPLALLNRATLEVAQQPSDTAAAAHEKGQALFEQGDYENAVIAFDEALRLDPQNARLYLSRGESWYKLKEHDKAIADFTVAQRADSDSLAAEAFASRAVVWHVRQDYARAIDDYKQCVQRAPKHAFSLNNLAWIYATCPAARYRDGGLAKDYGARACEATEWKDDSAIDTFAAALAESGNFRKAEIYLRQAIELNPENSKDTRAAMRQCFQERRPYRDGVGAAPSVAANHTRGNPSTKPGELPANIETILAEATKAYQAQHYDEAVRLAEQALVICPPDSHAELSTLFMLSSAQTALKNWDAALKTLERIEELVIKLPPRK